MTANILKCYVGVIASASLLSISIINFSLAYFLSLTIAPAFLFVRGGALSVFKPTLLWLILLSSPIAYSLYAALWTHCTDDDCESLLNNVIEHWTPKQWTSGIELKNDDYVDFALSQAEAYAFGIQQFAHALFRSLWALIQGTNWFLETGQLFHRVYVSSILSETWLYAFSSLVWWPISISMYALALI